jgi:hypothetical protein
MVDSELLLQRKYISSPYSFNKDAHRLSNPGGVLRLMANLDKKFSS